MGAGYIGLSPSNASDNRPPQKRAFLNECKEVCMRDGKPRAKYHAFGLSSMPVIRQFKNLLFSADAKSWAQMAGTGQILVPLRNKDVPRDAPLFKKWDYVQPDVIDIGNEAKRGGWFLKKDVDDEGEYKISIERRREIIEYIRDLGFHIGYSIIRRKKNTEIPLGEWEFVLKDTHKREEAYSGLKKGQSDYVWTEDFDLRGSGLTTEEAEPFIRYGLTNDMTLRMWCNVFATVHWSRTLDPDYYDPEMITDEDRAKQYAVFEKIRERLRSKKIKRKEDNPNFGF